MTPEGERALDRWCRFMGYGNPRATLWIVGIEEGGAHREGRFLELLTNDYRPIPGTDDLTFEPLLRRDVRERSAVWTFAQELMGRVFHAPDPKAVEMFSETSPIFLSNAYPLAKPNTKGAWPYRRYLSKIEYEQYVSRCRPEHFKKLRPLHTIVVGHGKGAWLLHRLAFRTGDETAKVLWNGELEIYQQSRLILAPFFWNRSMSRERIGEIATVVKKLMTTG